MGLSFDESRFYWVGALISLVGIGSEMEIEYNLDDLCPPVLCKRAGMESTDISKESFFTVFIEFLIEHIEEGSSHC